MVWQTGCDPSADESITPTRYGISSPTSVPLVLSGVQQEQAPEAWGSPKLQTSNYKLSAIRQFADPSQSKSSPPFSQAFAGCRTSIETSASTRHM